MGNHLSEVCLNCFSQSRRAGRRTKSDRREYVPPSLEMQPTHSFFPLKSVDTARAEESPAASFDFPAISLALDAAFSQFLLESAPCPSDELLLTTDTLRVYGRETARGLLLKTEWSVPYTPQTYLDFIRDFARRKQWDRTIEECRKVCYLSQNVSVNYQRYRKVLIMSARELLVACRSSYQDGSWFDISCSVTSPAFPICPPLIRAHVHMSGYRISPTASGCSITSISETDFGGSVPRSAMKKLSAVGLLSFTKSLSQALAASVPAANSL